MRGSVDQDLAARQALKGETDLGFWRESASDRAGREEQRDGGLEGIGREAFARRDLKEGFFGEREGKIGFPSVAEVGARRVGGEADSKGALVRGLPRESKGDLPLAAGVEVVAFGGRAEGGGGVGMDGGKRLGVGSDLDRRVGDLGASGERHRERRSKDHENKVGADKERGEEDVSLKEAHGGVSFGEGGRSVALDTEAEDGMCGFADVSGHFVVGDLEVAV